MFLKFLRLLLFLFLSVSCVLVPKEYQLDNIVFSDHDITIDIGEQKTISTTVTPPEYTKPIVYKADDSSICDILQSNNTIKVIGKKEGITLVKAYNTDDAYLNKSFIVNVNKRVVNIVLDNSAYTLKTNEQFQLTATIPDNVTYSSIKWDIIGNAPDYPAIDLLGNGNTVTILGINPGKVTVTASLPSGEFASCDIIVNEISSKNYITSTSSSYSLTIGTDFTLSAKLNGGTEAEQQDLTWSIIDNSIATLTGRGSSCIITPLKAGITSIVVSHPNSDKDYLIYIKISNLEQFISLNPSGVFLYEGQQRDLVATVLNGTQQDYYNLKWEVENNNTNIYLVGNGSTVSILGKSAGKSRIKVSLPSGTEAFCDVIVNAQDIDNPVKYISSQFSTAPVKKGTDINLSAFIENGSSNDNNLISWEVENDSIVSLIGQGPSVILTGLKVGSTKIKLTHPDVSDPFYMYIKVSDVEKNISLNKTSITLYEDEQDFLSATITNATQDDYESIEWSLVDSNSSDTLTLLGSGNTITLIAKNPGLVSVQAKTLSGDISICDVLVRASISSTKYITAPSSSLSLTSGIETTLTAELKNGTEADQQDLFWTVDDSSILSITGQGKSVIITPHVSGTTKIKLTHSLAERDYFIYVKVTDVQKSITLSASGKLLVTGQQDALTASITHSTPDDYESIFWTVEDDSILTLLGSGHSVKLFALNPGQTKVTASLPSGDSVTCDILINDFTTTTDFYITSHFSSALFRIGSDTTLYAELKNGTDADQQDLIWESKNPDILNVIGQGSSVIATPLKSGTTEVVISHPKTDRLFTLYVKVSDVAQVISLNKTSSTIIEGQQDFITASISNGSETDYHALVWEIVESTNTVTILGNRDTVTLVANSPGIAKLKASLPSGAVAYCDILVEQQNVESNKYITSPFSSASLKVGSDVKLNASIINGTDIDNQKIIWTTDDPSILTITGEGSDIIVTPLKEGVTKIIISHPDCTYSFNIFVKVTNVVQSITLSKTSSTLIEGQQDYVSASILNGSETDYHSLMWEITEGKDVVSVLGNRSNITLLAKTPGQAILKCSLPSGAVAYMDIYVKGLSSDVSYYITSPLSSISAKKGVDFDLGATLVNASEPEQQNIKYKVEDNSILSIMGEGKSVIVTPLKSGTTKITISHSLSPYTFSVFVKVSDLTQHISLNKTGFSFLVDQQTSINATITNGDINDKYSLVWTPDTPNIVDIIGSGESITVLALSPGRCKLKASLPSGAEAFCDILVKEPTDRSVKHIISTFSSVSLKVDVDSTLSASIYNGSDLDNQKISWSVEDESLISITGQGQSVIVTPLKSGTTKLIITHSECSEPYYIYLKISDVNQLLTLSDSSVTLNSGDQETISCSILNGSVYDYKSLQWSIPDNKKDLIDILGYEKSVTINAKNPGIVTLKVSLPSGASSYCDINVLDSTLNNDVYITSNITVASLSKGIESYLTASLVNASASDIYDMEWSVDNPSVLSLLGDGPSVLATPLSAGSAIVTVSHPKAAKDFKVFVKVSEVSKFISLDKTSITLVPGQQDSLSADISNGNDYDFSSISWSINNGSNITIIGSGPEIKVFAKAIGYAVLKCELPSGISAYCDVYVYDQNDFTPTENKYIKSQSSAFNISTSDSITLSSVLVNGSEEENLEMSWISSDPNIVSVLGSGKNVIISGETPGFAKITVSHPLSSNSFVFDIKVSENKQTLTLDTTAKAVMGGQQFSLRASITNASATDYNNISWDIIGDDSVINIIGSGEEVLVTALKTGLSKIKASLPNESYSTCDVSVSFPTDTSDKYLTSVQKTLILDEDKSVQIRASLVNGSAAEQQQITYSSEDSSIVSVQGRGSEAIVTANKAGSTRIKIIHPLYSSLDYFIYITVNSPKKIITLNKTGLPLIVGDSFPLTASISNGDKEDLNNIIWSVPSGISAVSILGNGPTAYVNAISQGYTTITASSPGCVSASCSVKVDNPSQTGDLVKYIAVRETTVSLNKGSDYTLTAELVNASPAEQSLLSWEVSDPSIISITGQGSSVIVTPIASGNCAITISHPSATNDQDIYIKVSGQEASISLSSTGLTLLPGDENSLRASLVNGSLADFNTIRWTLDPPDSTCVSIVGLGSSITLIANTPGTATVKATLDSGASASCEVYIRENKSLAINPTVLSLKGGASSSVQLTKSPASLTPNISISNPSIATFSYDPVTGIINITGVSDGNTRLTATAGDLSASVNISVTVDKSFSVSTQSVNLNPLSPSTFTYSCVPHSQITWTSSNPAAITVQDNGAGTVTVRSTKEGEATITGTVHGITRSLKAYSYYPNLSISIDHVHISGSNSEYYSKVSFTDNVIHIADFVNSQLTLSFTQPGVIIHDISWTESLDFYSEIEHSVYPDGRKIDFKFEAGWTAYDEAKDCGALTVTIKYSNNKIFQQTFSITGHIKGG